jgi:Uma2 family endonuclease
MRTASTSVAEYLSSVYDPDMDFVDGELEDRNVGEKDHAKLQFKLAKLLEASGNCFVAIETRIQVSSTRFRIPDVCVYEEEPEEQIFTTPPLLVAEILSPEDRMSRMQRKIEDYRAMGCPDIWILDPWRRKAYRFDGASTVEVQDELSTHDSGIRILLSELF